MVLFSVGLANAAPNAAVNEVVRLKSTSAGLCLAVSNGAPTLRACDFSNATEIWRLAPNANQFALQNNLTNQCLAGGAGSRVLMTSCNPNGVLAASQSWQSHLAGCTPRVGCRNIWQNGSTGQCLTASSTGVFHWACDRTILAEQWSDLPASPGP